MSLQKPQQQTLTEKISECREVVIQNMEKTIQHKMVFIFFKNNKLDNKIRNFSLNTKDGFIKVEFNEPSDAREFYEDQNFKEKILLRPFNIYYNLQLSDGEMKKYFIEGVTEQNQRAIFEAAMKVGPLKLYTHYNSYGAGNRNLKPKGILSFIRDEEICKEQMHQLTTDLRALNVTISPYVSEKGLRCSVSVYNFFKANPSDDDEKIAKEAEAEVRNLIKGVTQNPTESITVNVRRKPEKDQKDGVKVNVTAILEFADNDTTMNNFELLRSSWVNEGDLKTVLFLHNHENNSYFSLYTSGLEKREEMGPMTDKQFEDAILKIFRKVNPQVVQTNVFPVHYNKTYIGRIYFKTEEEGKNFIVDYRNHREELIKVFQNSDSINFNINVDAKTLKKIKQKLTKGKMIAQSLKAEELARREMAKNKNKAANTIPLGDVKFNGLPGMAGFGSHMPGGMQVNGLIPPKPPQFVMMGGMNSGMNALGSANGTGTMRSFPGFGSTMPPMMGVSPTQMGMGVGVPQNAGIIGKDIDPNKKLEQMLRDKEKFLKMDVNTAKRLILPLLKYLIERTGVSTADSGSTAERILKDDLLEVFNVLESQNELRKRIAQRGC